MNTLFDIYAWYMMIFWLLTVSLNGLVLSVLLKARKKFSSSDIFLSSLTVVNLIGPTVSIPFIVSASFARQWTHGIKGCTFHGIITLSTNLLSIFHFTLLAVERYVKLVKPLWSDVLLQPRNTCLALITVWTAAVVWGVCPAFGWSSYTLEGIGVACQINWESTARIDTSFTIS